MADHLYTTCDRFEADLASILGGVSKGVDERMEPAVRKSCAVARRTASKVAKGSFEPSDPPLAKGRYHTGFSSRVKTQTHRVTGEVGNRKYPGLVHLLEKGHAKMGGGRTRAFPHMAPAADRAFEDFEGRVSRAVDEALR